MSSNKTVATDASVQKFIDTLDSEQKQRDCRDLVALMKRVTGSEPKMWGSSMVGFGEYHYTYASGREGDFFITGFSPRKAALSVYVMAGFDGYDELLKKLGPCKTGKSCLYLKNLDVIDRDVLEDIVRDSVAIMRERYACK